ncbi:SurA N-terminal domain-containing protein [Methanocalculus sp. MSAO_Arc2]|uniref:SurA N-terminal domain-containing protein n=1 Tax=Methanocalculus sp. MSAO_Arc2 TaxID=2293855 RepID=UPI0026B4467A
MMKRLLMILAAGCVLLTAAFAAGCMGEPAEEEPMPVGPDEPVDPGEPIDPGEPVDPVPGGNDDGFEAARPQLEQQLRMEIEQQMIQEHVTDLEQQAHIETDQAAIDEGPENAVIAVVNGEELLRSEMLEGKEQQMQQFRMMGMDLSDMEDEEAAQMMELLRMQVVENLVVTTLVHQVAVNQGFSATEEDVDEYYQYFAAQAGGEEALEQQLEEAGMTPEDIREDIRNQLPVEMYITTYLEENLDPDMLVFSEEELRALYEQQQQQQQPAGFDVVEA